MNDDERATAALLEAIHDVLLEFQTEHDGKTIAARYRPAVAMTIQERLGATVALDSTPALAIWDFYADMLFDLIVDGTPVPMGRAAMTLDFCRWPDDLDRPGAMR